MFQFLLNLFNSVFAKKKKTTVKPKSKKVAGLWRWRKRWQEWKNRWGGGSW